MPGASIPQLFDRAVQRFGSQISLRKRSEPGRWAMFSWTDLRHRVLEAAAGLVEWGIRPGDRVAILSNTRMEWTLADYAILSAGAVTVPLYHAYSRAQLAFCLRNARVRVVFVANRQQRAEVHALRDRLPDLERIVTFDLIEGLPEQDSQLDQLRRLGRRRLRDRDRARIPLGQGVTAEQPATIIYTLGPSGTPRGIVLTHANLLAAAAGLSERLPIDGSDVNLLFLPLSHVFARIQQFLPLFTGHTTAYARRLDSLEEVLKEIRPTFFLAVPRTFERIYARVRQGYGRVSPAGQRLIKRGLAVSLDQRSGASGGKGPLERVARWGVGRLVERAVFTPLREGLGGRVRFAICGGAPLARELSEFFYLAGLPVLEGYGLTEASGVTSMGRLGSDPVGNVGLPLPGVQLRLAPDGEILLRGATVAHEFLDTAGEVEAFERPQGWFHTGDVGQLRADGSLVVTGRKRDLLVTSGGKAIPPGWVESALAASPLIQAAVVFGDRRPHLVALVVPHREALARALGRPSTPWEELSCLPEVFQLLETEVNKANERLARFEQVRAFAVFDQQLETTQTHQVLRERLERRKRALIDSLYGQQDDWRSVDPTRERV